MGDVVDDDDVDVALERALVDVGEPLAVGAWQLGVVVVGGDDFELGRVLGVEGVLLVSWQELVLGVLEVEVEHGLLACDDVGGDAHGEDCLAYIGLAEEACHLALVPESVPKVDGRRCLVDDLAGHA